MLSQQGIGNADSFLQRLPNRELDQPHSEGALREGKRSDDLSVIGCTAHAQISEADVYFEGNCFKFHCKPYFLHLQLPGKLADNGHAKSSYNVETGVCVCVWVELKLCV